MNPCLPDELDVDVSQLEKLASLDDQLLADTKPNLAQTDLGLLNYLDQVRKSLKEVWAAEQNRHTDSFKLPHQFGRFQLLELLGEGGQGIVFRANDPNRDVDVAIKLLNCHGRWGNQRQIRFEREARITSRIHSSHIAAVLEAAQVDDASYIVLPYCPGPSLAQWLVGQEGRAVPILDAVNLIRMLNKAVVSCHSHGILHRDLKPGNVLLFPKHETVLKDSELENFEPRICDFGLSWSEDDEGESITGSHTVLGSRAYMSPEQAEGNHLAVSTATDLWALGVILYELVTGKKPFGDDGKTLLKILTEPPISPSQLRSVIPKDLEAIILKCLSKSIQHRYSSVADFDDDLSLFVEGKPTKARPLGLSSRMMLWVRRRPWTAAAIVCFLMTLGIFAYAIIRYEYQLLDSFDLMSEKKREAEKSAIQLEDTVYAMTMREASELIKRGKEDVALDKLLQFLPTTDGDRDKRELAWKLLHSRLWNRMLTLLPRKTSVIKQIGRGHHFNGIISEGDVRLLSWDLHTGASRNLTSAAERAVWGPFAHSQICNFHAYNHNTRMVSSWSPDKLAWQCRQFKISDNVLLDGSGMIFDVSHDGRWTACSIPTTGILLHDRETGQQQLVSWPWLPNCPQHHCAFSNDSSKVIAVSHSFQPQIAICSVPEAKFIGHIDLGKTTNLLAMSYHGPTCWFCFNDGRLIQIDLDTASIVREHRLTQPESYLFKNRHKVFESQPFFCPAPATWVMTRTTGEVVRIDLDTGKEIVLTKHKGPICLILDAGDKQLLTVDCNEARLLDYTTGTVVNSWVIPAGLIDQDRSSFLHKGVFFRKEMTLVIGGRDGRLAIWRLEGARSEKTFQHGSRVVWTTRFAPNNQSLVTAGEGGNINCWNIHNCNCYMTMKGAFDLVEVIAFSDDSKIVVTGGSSRVLKVWDFSSGTLLRELKGYNESIKSVALSPDGKYVAVGLRKPKTVNNSMIVLWNLSTGNKVAEFAAHEDHVMALAFSPDSKLLYSGSEDQLIKTWEVSSQKLLNTIRDDQEVWHLRLHQDKLISAGNANAVSIWNLSDGALLHRFRDPDSTIRAFAISPDGKTVITGGETGPIRFWLTSNGQELTSFDVGKEKVMCLDVSRDGRFIAAGCVSGKVILLDIGRTHDSSRIRTSIIK